MPEPITVAELKVFSRISGSDEDDLLGDIITAAREQIELETDRTVIAKTLVLKRDSFPNGRCPVRLSDCPTVRLSTAARWLELPSPIARAVSSIAYIDANGAAQVFAASGNWTLDTAREPARINLADGIDWPDTLAIANAVTISYTAGWASVEAIPRRLKLAVLWLAAWWYDERLPVNIGNIVNQLPNHLQRIIAGLRTFHVYTAEVGSVAETLAAVEADDGLFSFPDITGETGGGSTKLDGVDTTTYGLGTIAVLSYGNIAQWWKQIAWTNEVETAGAYVIADDDPTKLWVRIA